MFALLTALAMFNQAPAPASPTPLKVLLVCGGCCHDYQRQKDLIAKGLSERARIEVTIAHEGGSSTSSRIPLYEKQDWSKNYDLVIHDECFADVKDTTWVDRVLKPHREGLPAVVLHCAMHSYRDGTDNWFQFCGVTSRRHGAAYPHDVTNVDAKHPIMKEFGPVWNNPAGELYWIEKVHPTAHPLAVSRNKETGRDEVSVWTNQYNGKTRVFGTTLGHHNETVASEEYLDLLTRGVLWAADKLEPAYLKPRSPRTQRNNLATGKTATASSEETGKQNFASKAIDGDLATRWCASGPNSGAWLQVDLGQPQPVTGVEIEWESADAAYRYKVETSTDGKTWTSVVDAGRNDVAGPGQHDFAGKGTRFVRVTYFGSNTGSWGSIAELRVLGDQRIVVPPVDRNAAADAALLREVKVPEGYEATIFARPPAVVYPVFVAAAPGGDLYVSVDRNGSLDRELHRGSVVRLRDRDGDGRADESKLFVKDVDSPRGLVFDHDRVYLMHPPHLSAFIDKNGDGEADEQKVLVKNIAFAFKDRPADHTSNGVTLGIDGWLYLAIGDFGFLEAEGTDGRKLQLRGGGVVRVRPDGTGLELYSQGTRNILEVSLDPLLNGFARDNTNDGGGWDIRLHHFSGLENHGYPSHYRNFTAEAVAPLADYGGGSGCGGLFLDEPGFPKGDSPALYTADWGRSMVFRHQMKPRGATFEADQQEFVGLPRVTDLDVDASSRLYVSSWRGASFTYVGENVGFILGLKPKGFRAEGLPDFEKLSAAELVELLKSPSARRRLEAQRALIRRGLVGQSARGLIELTQSPAASRETRVAAIFALKQGQGNESAAVLQGLLTDPSVAEFAARALTDRKDQLQGVDAGRIARLAASPRPRDRRQAAVSLARLSAQSQAGALIPLLDDSDALVAHTAIAALVSLRAEQEALAVVDRSSTSTVARTNALRVLQRLHTPTTVAALIDRLERENDPARRAALFAALCRLHDRDGVWTGDSWGTRPDTSGPYYQPAPWSETASITQALQRAVERASDAELVEALRQLALHKIYLARDSGLYATRDGLAELIAKAEKDERLIPGLLAQIVRIEKMPSLAEPFLVEVARRPKLDDTIRAQTVSSLVALGSKPAFEAVIAALPLFSSTEGGKSLQTQSRQTLLNAAKLKDQTALFVALSRESGDVRPVWASAVLLKLASDGNPVARQEIDGDWIDSIRKLNLLKAAALIEHRDSADRIRKLMGDRDPKVAQLARDALAALKLDQPTQNRRPGQTVKGLGIDRTLDRVVAIKGDVETGRQLFTRLNCVNCHTVTAHEAPKGPYLGNIAATYKRRELAEAVLRPSKTLAQGFVTTALALEDGSVVVGFVVKESADAVTIRTAEAKELTIPTSKIEERGKRDTSVMPEGLVDALTPREFASILDYLESLIKK